MWEWEVFIWFLSLWETPLTLTQGPGTHANLGATWSYAAANQAKGGTPSPIIWEKRVGWPPPPSFFWDGALVPGCPPHLGHPSHLCIPEGPAPHHPTRAAHPYPAWHAPSC